MSDISPNNPPCPQCGATWQWYAGRVRNGRALIHKKGCMALAPAPTPPPLEAV